MAFQTPRGTRDFLPEEMIKRKFVFDKVRAVFEKWGFDPIETPAFEDWALLSKKSGGGEEIKKEIYYFRDKSDRELGLRFEFTASFARVIASNPELPKPFRRYQIGPVWRYDRPGAGRYRELWQCDVDIAGAPVGEADAVCIAVAHDALKDLGFDDFVVRVSNRKIIQGFMLTLKMQKERIVDALRSVDKLNKIGDDGVTKELKEKKFDDREIAGIMKFIRVKSLQEARKLVEKEPLGLDGVAELEKLFAYLDSFGMKEFTKFDPSLIRGFEYYTGPVFEIEAKKYKLSIAGGGRYDNLIELYGGKPTPAVGIALGIDRIIEIMEENSMLVLPKTLTKVYVASVSDAAAVEAARIAKQLIALGVAAEFDLMGRSLSKQLDYVNGKGIPFVIVIGEKEIAAKKAKLRDMATGKETEVSLQNLDGVRKIIK